MPRPRMNGKPLTDQPSHEGRLLTPREQSGLQRLSAEEVSHALLDLRVGQHALMTAIEQLVGLQQRRILWSGSALITSAGIWHRRFPTGALGIFVVNFNSNGSVTVAAGEPLGAAPGPGAGTHNVPAGCAMVFNNETTGWAIYGTAGNVLDVQVFSIPITPAASGNI